MYQSSTQAARHAELQKRRAAQSEHSYRCDPLKLDLWPWHAFRLHKVLIFISCSQTGARRRARQLRARRSWREHVQPARRGKRHVETPAAGRRCSVLRRCGCHQLSLRL